MTEVENLFICWSTRQFQQIYRPGKPLGRTSPGHLDRVYEKLLKISDKDRFRATKINSLQVKGNVYLYLEAVGRIKEQEKKSHGKRTMKDYKTRIIKVNQNQIIKALIDFDKNNSNSIKSLAVKKNTDVNVTSRFMSRKMLTFEKFNCMFWSCHVRVSE